MQELTGSWLHLDAATADKLANNGANAAAARRDLLASAAATGTFGANALPGAYPAPPPPKTPGQECPPLCRFCTPQGVCTRCREFDGAGRTVYTAPNGACRLCLAANCRTCRPDGKCAECKVGFKAVNGVCQRVCKDVRCLACPAAANKCTRCLSPSGGFPIYLDLNGQCKACLKQFCDACNPTGNCRKCKAGYELDGRGGCRVICPLNNCAVCPGNRVCQTCKPGYQFLSATNRSQCVPLCFVPNCGRCVASTAGKKCFACKAGFVLSADRTRCTRRTAG
ncbi:hypothetical protein ABPG77_005973 [Micractinium sp. CCAP 211/92]